LKDENGRLYKLLGERDEEMRILRKARDEEKRALAGENFNIHIYNVYKLYCCVTLQSVSKSSLPKWLLVWLIP